MLQIGQQAVFGSANVITHCLGCPKELPPRTNADTSTGMVVGLALRLTSSTFIQSAVSFDYQFFFNLLLPPIILASGYELRQVRAYLLFTRTRDEADDIDDKMGADMGNN